ncbi:MAG: GPR endopeptidase [Clostridiales bacterium]|jgi:spore protease|nr:GPR endopeptidase [Clostridiales bacterium]
MRNLNNRYTDMAVELSGLKSGSSSSIRSGIEKTVSVIKKADEEKYGKPEGKYITIECSDFFKNEPQKENLSTALFESLVELIKHLNIPTVKKILVVGVGNVMMTADSLGPECANKINPVLDGKISLHTLIPNVIGMTGIESFDLVFCAAKKIQPDLIIAIDTLAANKTHRLSYAFQMSTSGLQPGGGVKNHRPALNFFTLNTPVIAVGVPLVVYAINLAKDILEVYGYDITTKKSPKDKPLENMIVTVKDINVAVGECSDVISAAISMFGQANTIF